MDEVCTLITKEYDQDELGQDIAKETEREIFCSEIPIYASEYNNAVLRGIKPTTALLIQKEEYNNESLVCYKGTKYTIYRRYQRNEELLELLELYCEVRTGVHSY